MEPKRSDLKTAEKLILNTFSFLENEYIYSVAADLENSLVFLESLDIKYTNEAKRRKITISYTKNKKEGRFVYTFNASITRIPYLGVRDFFSLSVCLNSFGKDFPTNIYNELDEIKAEAILNQIADALKKYAIKIIEGEVWYEVYYPQW